MPSWAGTGMVTICMLTFCIRSTNGTSSVRPGSETRARTRPNRKPSPRSYCLTTRTPAASQAPPATTTALRISTTMAAPGGAFSPENPAYARADQDETRWTGPPDWGGDRSPRPAAVRRPGTPGARPGGRRLGGRPAGPRRGVRPRVGPDVRGRGDARLRRRRAARAARRRHAGGAETRLARRRIRRRAARPGRLGRPGGGAAAGVRARGRRPAAGAARRRAHARRPPAARSRPAPGRAGAAPRRARSAGAGQERARRSRTPRRRAAPPVGGTRRTVRPAARRRRRRGLPRARAVRRRVADQRGPALPERPGRHAGAVAGHRPEAAVRRPRVGRRPGVLEPLHRVHTG